MRYNSAAEICGYIADRCYREQVCGVAHWEVNVGREYTVTNRTRIIMDVQLYLGAHVHSYLKVAAYVDRVVTKACG